MSDIITSDNLPLVIGAVFTGLAGLAVWRQGGKLGDAAKHLSPPGNGSQTVQGLAISSDGAGRIATALEGIHATLNEWWIATKHYREAKEDEVQQETLDRLRSLTDPDFVAAIKESYAKVKGEPHPRSPRSR